MSKPTIRTKLTKTYVDSASEAGFHWDSELTGFGLRISGTTKTYIVQSRIEGETKRRTVGRHGVFTAELARRRARDLLHQMAIGVDPKEEQRARQRESTTLAELFESYISTKRLAPRTEADYKGYMRKYFAEWLTLPITAIKPEMVQKRHDQLGNFHGAAQADVAMRCLRALYNFAEGVFLRQNGDPLVPSNPTKRLSALKQWFNPKGRETYIREETLGRWYVSTMNICGPIPSASMETVRDYLLFLLFTGLRRTEAAKLRWSDVDFSGRRFTLPRENTKNRTEFSLPMTTVTYDLLKARSGSSSSEFVFPGAGKSGHLVEPRYVMKKIADQSGVDFTLHDLRRTYATYASTKIDNPWTVKRLMNHLTGQDITQRYLQGIERLRAPAQSVTDYILQLVGTHGDTTASPADDNSFTQG